MFEAKKPLAPLLYLLYWMFVKVRIPLFSSLVQDVDLDTYVASGMSTDMWGQTTTACVVWLSGDT